MFLYSIGQVYECVFALGRRLAGRCRGVGCRVLFFCCLGWWRRGGGRADEEFVLQGLEAWTRSIHDVEVCCVERL